LYKVLDIFPEFIKKDYKLYIIKKLIILFKEHSELYSLITPRKIQFKKDNLIEFLLLLKKQPLEIIGLIESQVINPSILLNCINDGRYSNLFEHAKKVHEERLKKDILREKCDLGVFSSYCKELTLSSELQQEGLNMRHCVSGYAEKVKRNECRIFHINHNDNHSTLELISVNNLLQIKQHKAKYNEIPKKGNKTIATLLINYLNLYHKF